MQNKKTPLIINNLQFFDENNNPLTFKKSIKNITFIGVPNNDPIHYRWNIQIVGHIHFSDKTHQKFLFDFQKKKAFHLPP